MNNLLWVLLLFQKIDKNSPAANLGQIDKSIAIRYTHSLKSLTEILRNNSSFKESVMEVEQAFSGSSLDTADINYSISSLVNYIKFYQRDIVTYSYYGADSMSYISNLAICGIICNRLDIRTSPNSLYHHRPFKYNFQDPLGKQDWTNTFVSSLLKNGTGNCRSLTYLYKILADEVGAKCWLSLAPNHIYVRNYSQQIGWYNTELTSGTFPTDAWIAASGYVSTDAIRSGIYMDTLSNQQAIALCLLDLAKGYEIQTHNYYDGFIIKCCDRALQYHPLNPMALLLKAETLKKVYLKKQEDKLSDADSTYLQMEKAYISLAKLHYREMPEKMYQTWVSSLSKNSRKFTNEKVRLTKKTRKPASKTQPL